LADTRSDEAVLEAYRSGESEALETLIRRYHDDLMRFLIRLVGDRAGAEDVFQETFLQVHVSAASFDTSRRFKPWLFTIAANKARDLLRRTTRRRAMDLSAPVPGGKGGPGDSDGPSFIDLLQVDAPQPGQIADLSERDRMVQRAVSELPITLREVLLLAYFQRMSYNDVAEALQIPLGTVKSRLHAAVAAFARKWQNISKGEYTPDMDMPGDSGS
jgi:RNA polymerase sigma-70 factor, ECF subfamily